MINGYLSDFYMRPKGGSSVHDGRGAKSCEPSAEVQKKQVFNEGPVALKRPDTRTIVQESDAPISLESLYSSLYALMPSLKRLLQKEEQNSEQTSAKKMPDNKVAVSDGKQSVPQEVDSRQSPGLSKKKQGERPTNVWTGVMFSGKKNEPALSAIKAAMMRFGQSPLSVYSSVVRTESGYNVVMKDGFELSLTLKEIARAKVYAGFQHGRTAEDGGMFKDVIFMYAASAKRVQLESAGGAPKSFIDGLNMLCSYQDPATSLKQLGLEGVMRRTTWSALHHSGGIGIINTGGNTNFAFEGVLDGCVMKKTLPVGHPGVTYELI
ncbi:hypothetical protein [Pseudomonas marginalis]|uniref:Uncharacterized protein n=1 Tax=Pseudomonas marginalis TaxID=298 RepID=A0A9X5QGU5_PSEMA|nr:hypothetical protein [Pseudomonas marginalis]OAJ45715.1 hypothetical protein AO064_24545 [Pseudomonas marginalis]